QTAGTFRLAGGSAQSNNALVFQGGLVDAFGDINASISNNAMLRPALGGSGLHVTGNVSLLGASNLVFQLGGLTQGSQYGFMNVNGNVSLGGQLLVSFVSGFQNSVTNSNSFTVLSSTATFSGIFANIASGSRLDTTDSAGSFLVTYNGSNVVLSDYQPHVPRPALKSPLANNAVKQLSGVGRDERTAGSDVATMRVAERNQVVQKTNGDPAEAERRTAARPARNVALDMKSSSQLLQLLDDAPAASAGGKINIDPAHAKRIAAGRVASNPVTSANRGRIDTGAKNRNDDTSANASSSRAEMSRTTVISRGATQ
ncbi:MAG: hypothetical protein ACXWFY_04120, partial [Chthoniobacterales bacterium]